MGFRRLAAGPDFSGGGVPALIRDGGGWREELRGDGLRQSLESSLREVSGQLCSRYRRDGGRARSGRKPRSRVEGAQLPSRRVFLLHAGQIDGRRPWASTFGPGASRT